MHFEISVCDGVFVFVVFVVVVICCCFGVNNINVNVLSCLVLTTFNYSIQIADSCATVLVSS